VNGTIATNAVLSSAKAYITDSTINSEDEGATRIWGTSS